MQTSCLFCHFNDCGFDPTNLSGSEGCRVARRVLGGLSRRATWLVFQNFDFYVFETAGGEDIRFLDDQRRLGGD